MNLAQTKKQACQSLGLREDYICFYHLQTILAPLFDAALSSTPLFLFQHFLSVLWWYSCLFIKCSLHQVGIKRKGKWKVRIARAGFSLEILLACGELAKNV
ncbi:hypothetical protein DsansV1_C12g0115561 [Dioscorea sansibarensis]